MVLLIHNHSFLTKQKKLLKRHVVIGPLALSYRFNNNILKSDSRFDDKLNHETYKSGWFTALALFTTMFLTLLNKAAAAVSLFPFNPPRIKIIMIISNPVLEVENMM